MINMIFFLLGMTASGKTTIGHAISKLRKCKFIDLDKKIANTVSMSVRSFYEKYGKKIFQQIECNELKEVLLQCKKTDKSNGGKDFLVISAGGGLIENQDGLEFLKEFCSSTSNTFRIFFLDAPAKILWKRLLKKAKKEKTFPAFLRREKTASTSEVLSLSQKQTQMQFIFSYRSIFLAIYKRRMLLFKQNMKKLCCTKIKCKRRKVKKIVRIMIKKMSE